LEYALFWVVTLAIKFAFSYFVILKDLIDTSRRLYNNDVGSSYKFFKREVSDEHNMTIIFFLWLGSIAIYFVDTPVWFVVVGNIVAAYEALKRRVGEVNSTNSIVSAFADAHKLFWSPGAVDDEGVEDAMRLKNS
jgi:callose synthase